MEKHVQVEWKFKTVEERMVRKKGKVGKTGITFYKEAKLSVEKKKKSKYFSKKNFHEGSPCNFQVNCMSCI